MPTVLSKRELTKLADQIENELRDAGSGERAVNEKRYLKSALEHFGTPVPKIRKLTRAAIKKLDLDREAVLPMVTAGDTFFQLCRTYRRYRISYA
ncbi:MAG: DNA alkylation repair protein [Thermoanaerobaculia bacterium]